MEQFDPQDITRIEAYLRGDLPAEELAGLQADAAFQEQVAAYQTARAAVDAFGDQHLRDSLRAAYLKGETTRVRSLRAAWITAAAAVVLILVMVFWPRTAPAPGALYAKYYAPITPSVASRGDAPSDSLLQRAFSLYQEKAYSAAIAVFEQALADSVSHPGLAQTCLAICWLETGNPLKAIALLEAVPSADSYYWDARWYLALAFLQQENLPASRNILSEVAGGSKRYGPRAAELLQALEGVGE